MRNWALGLGLCALTATGACAKARAEVVPDGPPLSVPNPPARVLMPVEEPTPVAEVTPEPPPVATPRPAPPRPPVRRPTAGNEAERPEPQAPAAATVTPQPATPTRPAPSPADVSAERAVRDILARATRDINRVDYGRLSADGRAQYEQSKRFTTQAEDALKDRNFPFATTLADKAAQLAAELLGSR